MLNELPKLFDRNFVVGFFLPALILAVAFAVVIADHHDLPARIDLADLYTTPAVVASSLLIWLAAILLMALNRPMVRLLEGYGALNPLRLLRARARRRFRIEAAPPAALQECVDLARRDGRPEPARPDDHAGRLRAAVDGFPDREEDVLATRFGNAYRAVEVYSRVVYGFDAIPAWGRIETFLSQDHRRQIAEAQAQIAFGVNLAVGLFAALVLHLALAAWHRAVPDTPATALALAAGSRGGYLLAIAALSGYGLQVRSAFDLHRAALAEKLGLALPRSAAAEREMWREVSRMMIYRSPHALDRLVKFRKRD